MKRVAVVLLLALAGLAALAVVRLFSGERRAPRPSVAVVEALSTADSGFARADAPRPLAFPGDHGPHPEFRTEWWYYTGNLSAADGRRFGYQLTFFRIGLTARPTRRDSRWAARDAWMAHFALTDVGGRRFHARHRLARGALDLAGADARPFRVWLEDWSAVATAPDASAMRLVAREGDVALALDLRTMKPPALQGDRGWSRKGPEPGNASYYYSLTRLETRGHVSVGADRVAVTGTSWMDREWSTSALGAGQVGWDWFALQLDDGRDVMIYRLRRADGAVDPFSAGSVVARDGTTTRLDAADVHVEAQEWWTSRTTDVRYPSRWRVSIPREHVTLDIAPRLADQEWTEPVRYWEGAVTVRGTAGQRPVAGEGYVELVGYGDATARRSRARTTP
ncbi:MAG: carotenoid 1,2-hydratase [Candidatus Rokubacteria bacterium]|nr:carotenoid 1,2-hydratase [Candidatus Rokubacteria bacterium]